MRTLWEAEEGNEAVRAPLMKMDLLIVCKTTGGREARGQEARSARLPKSEDKCSLLPGELKVLVSSVASTINEMESVSHVPEPYGLICNKGTKAAPRGDANTLALAKGGGYTTS